MVLPKIQVTDCELMSGIAMRSIGGMGCIAALPVRDLIADSVK